MDMTFCVFRKNKQSTKAMGSLNKNPHRTDKPPDNSLRSTLFFVSMFLLLFFSPSIIFSEEGIVDYSSELSPQSGLDLRQGSSPQSSRRSDSSRQSNADMDSTIRYVVEDESETRYQRKQKKLRRPTRKSSFSQIATRITKSKKEKRRRRGGFTSMAKQISKSSEKPKKTLRWGR